ncbi:putative hydrolase of the HAD superfamily [Flavobacterium arsenatis]|uniref:Hydrolase of the HAD superfamily n=1 Tax=Flavobacterium arsenatis TaxID=1484332 RepID=A0ABU1TPI1_9FLAO|nr:YjjG family noncanonical pyrimidine nucleotidase [Flavobacterium arsenatis]MDR6967875.1 putative hydrolase of the HAD superfamily [Flavobacterium arsenatis]
MEAKISDVFFDLDHTLWDFEKNSALAFQTVLTKHKIEVDIDLFVSHYVPINLKYWELYRVDKITQTQLRYGRLKDTFDLLSYEIEDEKIFFLSDEYIHYLPQFNHLFEGTIEILEYLKPKYNLHIITNGFHEIQSNKLKNSNIGGYFQTITNSESAGVKKPNPRIFEYAITSAKAKKENSIMIGDCIEADVKGALNFGLDAILFNECNAEVPENIKHINNLLALKKYL